MVAGPVVGGVGRAQEYFSPYAFHEKADLRKVLFMYIENSNYYINKEAP